MSFITPIENEAINTLEKAKFEQVGDRVYVQTKTIGNLLPSGLSIRLKTTTLEIGTTPVKLPTSPLPLRNHIEIQNLSSSEILYIGDSNSVTPDAEIGETSGKEIPPLSFYNIDIAPSIEIWGVIKTGTAKCKVTEVS